LADLTFLSALRHDRVTAPWMGRSMASASELTSREHPAAGDIVILDNLASHRGQAVRLAIRAASARGYRFGKAKFNPPFLFESARTARTGCI
jgi:hypothetical protein